MKAILLSHSRKYPRMEPRDAVKLLYQSEFGGGHLIRDESQCRARLLAEYAETPQCPEAEPIESIGKGMVRVHLGALDAAGYDPQRLCGDFIRSAATVRGSLDAFRADLEVLKELTAAGHMPFCRKELEDYLWEYEAQGFPPVSHSEVYRQCYKPAYRVLDASFLPDLPSLKTGRP